MINVKDQVYAALRKKLGEEIEITDSYPKTWSSLPAVQYVEEENRVWEHTDGKEQKAYCRYRIDIWHNASTSAIALQVDDAIAALGLQRTGCGDVDDPSGLKHKMMRYERIIDVHTEQVYSVD